MRTTSLWFGLLSCLAAGAAPATTRVVTSTTDDINDVGSLRHMIQIADAHDMITFDLQYPAVIELSGVLNPDAPTLRVQKSLTFFGPGPDKLTVHAYSAEGIGHSAFEVYQPFLPDSDVSVAISGLAIENAGTAVYGDNLTDDSNPFQTYLALADVAIRCSTGGSGVRVFVGMIMEIARATMSDCGDALVADSFEPYSPSFVTVADSTFSNARTALYAENAAIEVTNSTIASTGGNQNGAVHGDVNSTITLAFTTIVGTSDTISPSIQALDASAVITLKNSLVAGNPVGNCAGSPVFSDDYNISDDASCSLGATHDTNNVPAGLDPGGLGWNGGPTQTIWLLPGSPALNAIPIANCTDAADKPISFDQRGATRPGVACDIGALESDRILAANFE